MARRKLRTRPKHVGKPPIHFRTSDALMFSGVSVLIAIVSGASADKALEYGIAALRLLGGRVEVETESEPIVETPFMEGLA